MKQVLSSILVAILAVFLFAGCGGVNRQEVENVHARMIEIHSAAQEYYLANGEWPDNVSILEDYDYLGTNRNVDRKWDFTFQGQNRVIATSTVFMSGGEGQEVRYDVETGLFTGYGSE